MNLTDQQSKVATLSYYLHLALSIADSLDVGTGSDARTDGWIEWHEIIEHCSDAIALLPEVYQDESP